MYIVRLLFYSLDYTPPMKDIDYILYIAKYIPYDMNLKKLPYSFFYTPSFYKNYVFPKKDLLPNREITKLLTSVLIDIDDRIRIVNEFISKKEEEMKIKYGDVGMCLYSQHSLCKTIHIGQYEYTICLFDQAKQDHTSLGTWEVYCLLCSESGLGMARGYNRLLYHELCEWSELLEWPESIAQSPIHLWKRGRDCVIKRTKSVRL